MVASSCTFCIRVNAGGKRGDAVGRGFAALRREGVVIRGRRRPVPHYTTAMEASPLKGGSPVHVT